ncbi:MAG: cache domain-containing protein, partial [Chloroflexi bacterium]|nr:cache domain-containing protein [Chloroflexota bacterium]
MLAVGVLPLALTALVTLQLSKAYLRELAVKRSEAVLDTVRADLERYATHRIHQLQMLAAGPAVQGLEPAKAGQAMADFLGSTSFFSEVQLLRASGEAIAATASPARSELPAPDRAALRAWLGGLSVPDLAQAPARVTTAPGRGGRPLCIYTVAVPSFGDPARPVGALRATAVLDGTGIQDVLGSYALQEDDYLAILDPTAEIVARALALDLAVITVLAVLGAV